MKATGIVRNVDSLGRIVIPKELREVLGIALNDPIEIFEENEHIMLKKYEPGCIFCGEMNDVIYFKEKRICRNCVNGA
jgi:transcriptional pleiotropic regulator of transition state genes